MAQFILANETSYNGVVLRPAKVIDDTVFDPAQLRAAGGILILLPNAAAEARAAEVRQQQARGAQLDLLSSAFAESGGTNGDFGTADIKTTGALILSNTTTGGAIRLGNGQFIKWRRNAIAADIDGITVDNFDQMQIGDYTNLVAVKVKAASTAFLATSNDAAYLAVSATSISGVLGSVTRFNVSTTEFGLSTSLVGGFHTQAMADAPQTISAANSVKTCIRTTGANTLVRALTISTAPTEGVLKLVRNDCTGSGITVQFSSGAATGTILPGTSAWVAGNGTNAFIMMLGT